jgi:hypothetical protein
VQALSRDRGGGLVLSLAAAATLLNALKPIHIDDAAYCAFAAHIARNPLDPYARA